MIIVVCCQPCIYGSNNNTKQNHMHFQRLRTFWSFYLTYNFLCNVFCRTCQFCLRHLLFLCVHPPTDVFSSAGIFLESAGWEAYLAAWQGRTRPSRLPWEGCRPPFIIGIYYCYYYLYFHICVFIGGQRIQKTPIVRQTLSFLTGFSSPGLFFFLNVSAA